VAEPVAIAAGPDGALWFAGGSFPYGEAGFIGRITTNGAMTIYSEPGIGLSGTADLIAGPDGSMWLTNYSGDSVERIATSSSR